MIILITLDRNETIISGSLKEDIPENQVLAFRGVNSTVLFYACNCCNRRKGNYWPGDFEEIHEHFIPNPCDHVMFEHLRYNDAKVDEQSETGNFTIEHL